MTPLPDSLGRTAVWLLGYGAVCTCYGMVFGYVLGPSIAQRLRALLRRR